MTSAGEQLCVLFYEVLKVREIAPNKIVFTSSRGGGRQQMVDSYMPILEEIKKISHPYSSDDDSLSSTPHQEEIEQEQKEGSVTGKQQQQTKYPAISIRCWRLLSQRNTTRDRHSKYYVANTML